MATMWGSRLSGRLEQISEDHELKIDDEVKLKQDLEVKVGLMMPSFKQMEEQIRDEIIKSFPDEQGIDPKFIQVYVEKPQLQPYPDTWIVIAYVEIHGIVVHESPINWGLIGKALLWLVALIFGTPIGQIIILVALAWLFVGQILPKLADYGIFILLLFVLFIGYTFLKGAKGKVIIKH